MEDPKATSAIVTRQHPCLKTEGHALLSVNAGVPVQLVLEQACTLLICLERVVLNRENLGEQVQTNCLHYLTDLTRAMVSAGYDGLYHYERTAR